MRFFVTDAEMKQNIDRTCKELKNENEALFLEVSRLKSDAEYNRQVIESLSLDNDALHALLKKAANTDELGSLLRKAIQIIKSEESL